MQNLVPTLQIPTAMAIVLFCQQMGGAVSLVAANSIFSNELRKELYKRISALGVEPDVVINAGARSVRSVVSGDALAAALEAYSIGVSHVMYLGIGVSVGAFAFGWGLGFTDIRKEKKLHTIEEAKSWGKKSKVGENGVMV